MAKVRKFRLNEQESNCISFSKRYKFVRQARGCRRNANVFLRFVTKKNASRFGDYKKMLYFCRHE